MICVDGSRSSPSLASIPAKVVRSVDSRSQQRQIVVVAEGQPSGPVTDTEVQRLSSVPAFAPLLHGSVSLSDDRPPQLDARHVLALCTRYQDHLHQSAEAVAFDQNALCVRIKEESHVAIIVLVSYMSGSSPLYSRSTMPKDGLGLGLGLGIANRKHLCWCFILYSLFIIVHSLEQLMDHHNLRVADKSLTAVVVWASTVCRCRHLLSLC